MKLLLAERRKQLGLTQKEVAQLIGIAESAYQRYEYGNRTPAVDTAVLIARALQSTVEKLFIVDND